MKKILALVLALVMTMSLATISSGAAFSDADKVQYTDAVNTMSALGVLGGYADGSIRPQADVTRGAAAKMVAMVATGSNATTIGYYKGTSSFSDVPATHTFADAVAFCVARGIVAGYGNGTYGVGDNVKGWAVAKMVLVAMGYDAKAYGMEGTGSALNTITLASTLGLFNGMAADFNANDAASREECAQIVYNALTVEGVMKGFVNSDGSYTYQPSNACLLDNYMRATEGTAALAQLTKSTVVENQATGNKYTVLANGTKLTAETGLDMIGHYVTYDVTPAAANADGAVAAYAVVDLSTVATADWSYTAKKDNFKALFGTDALTEMSGYKSFTNYDEDAQAATGKFSTSDWTVADGEYVLYNDGTATKVVSYLAPSTFDVGYVDGYTAGTAAKNGSVSFVSIAANSGDWTLYTKTGETTPTTIALYDGIAVGDIVAVQQTGDIYTATKLSTVTGKVTAVNNKQYEETITIGGQVYYQSDCWTATASDVMATGSVIGWTAALNQDVVAYIDATGAVVAMTAVDTSIDAGLVYVVDKYSLTASTNNYGGTATSWYAQCVDMSGKEVSYLVAAESDVPADGLYKVTQNYNTTLKANVATFGTADVANTADGVAVSAASNTAGVTSTTKVANNYYYADGVKFIYVSGSKDTLKVSVKEGAQKIAAGVAYDYYATKGVYDANYTVQYVIVAGSESTAVASTDVVYVAVGTTTKTATYTQANGQPGTAYVYNVYINGEAKEVMSTASSLTTGFKTYSVDAVTGMYSFETLSEGVYTDIGVTNLYGTKLTAGTDKFVDSEAGSAKIVDLAYAAMTAAQKENATEATTLNDLIGSSSNARISAVYTVDATGAKTVNTIYVLTQAVNS